MKKFLLLIAIVLIIPLIQGQNASNDCNTNCIDAGYSSGICSTTCEDVNLGKAKDCTVIGQAFLAIGTEAVDTYSDGDPFIGENKTDPNWVWIIQNIRTNARTNILDTDDDSQHSGPLIGVKNKFIAADIDNIGMKAKKIGESFCFPDSIICIKFKKLTVSDYGTYNIQKTTVDLSSFNSSWTNKAAILIHSVDDPDGLTVQTGDYDSPASGANGVSTDKMWIIYNDTGAYGGVFYEAASNAKTLAGYINLNVPADDVNIADISYKKTQDNNVQIDLRGTFNTVNNLDLVLDILAEEGDAATDGNDDITINLMHSANSSFAGFGTSSSTAEDADLVWTTTNIGKKDEDHRSLYGVIITDPNTNNAQDKAVFEIPADQVKAEVEITRKASSVTKVEAGKGTVLGEQIPSPILSSELKLRGDYDLVLIGGPCANPPLETFEEFPTCEEWPLKNGEAMIRYAKNGANTALLIAGTTAEDTRMATRFMKDLNNLNGLKGTYIKISNNKPAVIISSSDGIDISDYPVPFIKEGKMQNYRLVVGNNAKADDTIGAQDIASSFLSLTRTVTTYANESKSLNSSTQIEEIPLGNNLGDTNFFSKRLTQGTIKTLIQKQVNLAGNSIGYEEVVLLYGGGPSMATSLSSSDDSYGSEVYMEATSGSLRYYHAFNDAINIALADANSPLTINILDNKISITDAVTATQFKSQKATEIYMKPGDKVKVEGVEVELRDIDKNGAIIVRSNNTEEIIPSGKYEVIGKLKVKNVETFDIEGSECCCASLLSNLL